MTFLAPHASTGDAANQDGCKIDAKSQPHNAC
jgi:hypothetical protein